MFCGRLAVLARGLARRASGEGAGREDWGRFGPISAKGCTGGKACTGIGAARRLKHHFCPGIEAEAGGRGVGGLCDQMIQHQTRRSVTAMFSETMHCFDFGKGQARPA